MAVSHGPIPASELHPIMRNNRAAAAALDRLKNAGLTYSARSKGSIDVIVADRFYFSPSVGFWRAIQGEARGYDVGSLIEAAQKETRIPGASL